MVAMIRSTVNTDRLVCPYCGFVYHDIDDINDNVTDRKCEGCLRTFEYFADYTVYYIGREKN